MRKGRFPKLRKQPKAPAPKKQNWFQKIPLGIKILFVIVIIVIIWVIYWQIRKFIRQKNVQVTVDSPATSNIPHSQIHILFHLYRSSPDILAQSIFGAFEAAKYPGLVHVHVFQELCVDDGYIQDAYDTYIAQYSRLHSWDTAKICMDTHFHVVNENPSQTAGHFVSLLTLTQESVLPILGPHDIVVAPQAFYDSPGTIHIFPLTFAQDYDQTLRTTVVHENTVYSGKLPRTSLSATNATQVTTLTASLTQALSQNVVIPFFKSREHSKFLESRMSNVCSANAASNLFLDQTGFTAYTSSDRVRNVGVRQENSSDVPFTFFRLMREYYAPTTHRSRVDAVEWATYSQKHKHELVQPVPVVGIHEDIVLCKASSWRRLLKFAHGAGRQFLIPGPYFIQTLVMSNLMVAFGFSLLSMNHIPICAIFDHLTGASARINASSLANAKTMEPHNWMVVWEPASEHSSDMVRVKLRDPCDRVEVCESYEHYAGVTEDNMVEESFLGITSQDTRATIMCKFSSQIELDRQKRMLKAIKYPAAN